ncbi:MAG: class I SAM-dependent methyltransferase, partial [Ignavibacteriae bacterium]|nr:class I SAM-dependent methyltransferase [Ignavibacteriota bacterium]
NEAKKNVNTPNIQFLNTDISDYKPSQKFNLIFSIRAIEYFPDKEKFIKKCYDMLDENGKIFIITKTKVSYWYGRSKIRKVLKVIFPFLFYYENKETTNKQIQNLSNFQQQRISTTEFKNLLKNNGFINIEVKPVIIRPPIFMRGKTEIPIIPPFLEKLVLAILIPIDNLLSKSSLFTIFAESFSITGTKK